MRCTPTPVSWFPSLMSPLSTSKHQTLRSAENILMPTAMNDSNTDGRTHAHAHAHTFIQQLLALEVRAARPTRAIRYRPKRRCSRRQQAKRVGQARHEGQARRPYLCIPKCSEPDAAATWEPQSLPPSPKLAQFLCSVALLHAPTCAARKPTRSEGERLI